MSASPAVPAASPSPSSSALSPPASSSGVFVPSAQRYAVPGGYDASAQPNPCAHVPPIKVVPMQFAEARKPVDFQAGWEYFRRIGSPRHIMAPMVNQSELAFRLLCKRYNTTLAYSPMMHAEIFSKDPAYRASAMQAAPGPDGPQRDRPLVMQFCGNDPQTILKAAKHAEQFADAVDLNLGCPQGIARRGHYGAFLLEEPQLLHDIVSTLHQHLSIPVSVKIRRIGSDENTVALVRMLEEAGAALVTVHGRTRQQMKDKVGACDFDLIRLIKQNARVPVFANGGIYDADDVACCLAYTGCDGVMSSEALLCNPSLFAGKRVDALQIAREYLDIVEEIAPTAPTEPSMVRGHLFKILYRHLTLHPDLRDRLGACPPDGFPSLLSELGARFASLDPAGYAAALESVPVWYLRHMQSSVQSEEMERKKAAKAEEQRAREEQEEEALCAGACLFGED